MIENVLNFIKETAERYITEQLGNTLGDEKVVLTTFVDDAGKTQIPNERLGLSLLNIEHERTFRAGPNVPIKQSNAGIPEQAVFLHKPVDVNLQLIFTANFSNYQESLKHISYVIQCFQSQTNLVFEPQNAELDPMPLHMEINTLPLEQQHYIWSMIGLRYLPSVVYRLRMVRIQDINDKRVKPVMKSMTFSECPKEEQD
jgi:hypothetical protein